MFAMPFELPAEVLDLPGNEPTDLSRWDGSGVPAAVLLSWAEDAPFTPSTVALLTSIDMGELAASDLPRLLKALDRLESHVAAKKAIAVAQLARECRDFKGWDDQDPAANETAIALRLPL